MGLKFIHFADAHIGVENYGRVDPQTGLHTRLLDFVKSLEAVAERALADRVDFALFAGDAYRTCDPNPTHQREFARQINRLARADIPVVLLTGNHDHPVAFGRATAVDIFGTLDVANVHLLTKPRLLHLETKSGPVQIACLPWPTRSLLLAREEYKDLTEDQVCLRVQEMCAGIINHFAEQLNPAVPSIFAAHLAAAEATYSGSERSTMIGRDPVFFTSTLAHPAFDYVALGHIHKFQDINPYGHPHVVYAGSLERIDFGEAGEDKGFVLVSIGEGETPEARETIYQFVPTPARPFLSVEVTIRGGEEPTEKIIQAIREHDLTDAIVRVLYTVNEEQQGLIDLKAVREALEPAFLIASIVRQTETSKSGPRAEITEHLGLREALDRYLIAHPELQPFADDMRTYAQRLEQELEAAET